MGADFTITGWFDDTLWLTYPRDLCNRIGSKSKAMMAAKQKIKDEADANTVISGLREQMRYYRKIKKSGAHGSEWKMPMLSTWLNGEQWTNEIPSHYEHKQKMATKQCECGEPTIVGRLCIDCYYKLPGNDDWRTKALRKFFVEKGYAQKRTESHDEWIARLQKHYKEDFRKIG